MALLVLVLGLVFARLLVFPILARVLRRYAAQRPVFGLLLKFVIVICLLLPVLVIAVDWRGTPFGRVDLPLPLLLLVPALWLLFTLYRLRFRGRTA